MDCGGVASRRCILRIVTYLCALSCVSFGSELAWGRSSDMVAHNQLQLCRQVIFAHIEHDVCEIDPKRYQINLHWKDASGRPYGTLGAVERELEGAGRRPIITMNAGMYEADLSPVGLFIADGEERRAANLSEGNGNFYLKPNGVFYIKKNRQAGVMETQMFLRSAIKPDIATQSGPLLVIKGRIHPRLQLNGASRKIRNGVGVRRDGTVVLAISRQGISFGQFARLFRDELQCLDALYLDGTISRFSHYGKEEGANGQLSILSSERRIGPVISVSMPR